MVTKRKTTRAASSGLTTEQACKILQVAPSADEEIVTQAYWHLARKHQAAAKRDRRARKRLDDLNKAFLVLNPGRTGPPTADDGPPPPTQPAVAPEISLWLRRVLAQTQARWHGRVPEVGVLTVAVMVLTFFALSAGASVPWTLVTAGIAAVTIWAPWRKI